MFTKTKLIQAPSPVFCVYLIPQNKHFSQLSPRWLVPSRTLRRCYSLNPPHLVLPRPSTHHHSHFHCRPSTSLPHRSQSLSSRRHRCCHSRFYVFFVAYVALSLVTLTSLYCLVGSHLSPCPHCKMNATPSLVKNGTAPAADLHTARFNFPAQTRRRCQLRRAILLMY